MRHDPNGDEDETIETVHSADGALDPLPVERAARRGQLVRDRVGRPGPDEPVGRTIRVDLGNAQPLRRPRVADALVAAPGERGLHFRSNRVPHAADARRVHAGAAADASVRRQPARGRPDVQERERSTPLHRSGR